MKSEVIVQVMHIRRPGQVFYFQVNLPPHVSRVVAIQAGLRITGTAMKDYFPWETGMLTLQAEGSIHFCYNHTLLAEPNRLPPYDLGLTIWQAGFAEASQLQKDMVANRGRHEPDPVDFPKTRTLYGVYKDRLGDRWDYSVGYTLTLTLWTTTKAALT